jgi:hypothetical protein
MTGPGARREFKVQSLKFKVQSFKWSANFTSKPSLELLRSSMTLKFLKV